MGSKSNWFPPIGRPSLDSQSPSFIMRSRHGGVEPNPSTNTCPPIAAMTTGQAIIRRILHGTPDDHCNLTAYEFIHRCCFLCSKEIDQRSAIYMYSEKCRFVDIDKDTEEEKKREPIEKEENCKSRNTTNKRRRDNPYEVGFSGGDY